LRLTEKPLPFSHRNMLMPLWRGFASGSVFASTAKHEPWMPFEIHVLVPFRT
jgi:hypothetical protein